MASFLTNTQRTYGKQIGTGFVVSCVWAAAWIIENIITGKGPWVWVFPFLKARSLVGLITSGGIVGVAFLLVLIWILRPSDYRVEYLQQ